jgi:hypothetical protein
MTPSADEPDTVLLYRVIGPTELRDVHNLGDYGLNPNGMGKYFALTEEGVRNFARSRFNHGRRLTLTVIRVPVAVLTGKFRFPDAGGAGDSVYFELDDLPELYAVMGPVEILGPT